MALEARDGSHYNSAFTALLLLGKIDDCLELLISVERLPEAAFFARTYCPSQVPCMNCFISIFHLLCIPILLLSTVNRNGKHGGDYVTCIDDSEASVSVPPSLQSCMAELYFRLIV